MCFELSFKSRSWVTCLLAVYALLNFSALTVAQSPELGNSSFDKFEFALIGDVPYSRDDFDKFDRLIRKINADPRLEWVLHAGDIKSGLTVCTDAVLIDRLQRFQQFNIPFILTPGDNEWTDCHRFLAGLYNPLERLARLRELFYANPGGSLGQKTVMVRTQASDPHFSEYVENLRWRKNHVVFATVHIVGSNNGWAQFSNRTEVDDIEARRRTEAAMVWIKQTFEEARNTDARGVFILFHANPNFEYAKGTPARLGFDELIDLFEQESAQYAKPILLAHGDSHRFRVDKPLQNNEKQTINHVARVETFGASNVHWVRVTVDPASAEVFTIQKQIIKKNR
ncbi:MAG: metallophosphoesterase [Nitrosomonas sp.]|nr:metallophosphoesterase [Nitrosomonas sp.]